MNCSGISNEMRNQFNEKIRLRKERRQGHKVEVDFHQNIAHKVVDLQQKTQEVVEELVPRLNHSTSQINALTQRVIQCLQEELQFPGTERIELFQKIQKQFKETLLHVKEDLESEKRQKEELLNMLSTLRQKLKDAPKLPFSGVLHEAGERASYRVATGRQMPGREEQIGRQSARIEQITKQNKI